MAVNLKWCCNKKEGIQLIEPNDNLSFGYIQMAENAIGTMNREKSLNMQFAISACYYSMYYSLYSILMKIGVKCEIYSCTLKFMEEFLLEFYSKDDIKIINKAFECRNAIQYYADKIIDKEDSDFIILQAPFFLNKSKEILSQINENNIKHIRNRILETINKL